MIELADKTIPIIVLNWNGIEDTIECMTSILKMPTSGYEVYLVDNNSDNNEGTILAELYQDIPYIHVIQNAENFGFARGNNKIIKELIKKTDIEYIALLNNDTVVTPNWLVNLLKSALQYNADMVSSKMINYYDRSVMDNAGHFMLNTAEILPVGHAKPIENFEDSFKNIGACGGGALYSVKMIKDIGFFDEFFETGYEDAEYGLRANKMGYLSIYSPSARLYHKVSRSIKKIRNDDYFVRIQRNIFYTYFKLIPSTYIIINIPFILAKYFILFVGAIITLKFNIIKLHLKTIHLFFTRDMRIAIEKRNQFIADKNKAPFLNRIQFFIKTDFKRFLHLFKASPDN